MYNCEHIWIFPPGGVCVFVFEHINGGIISEQVGPTVARPPNCVTPGQPTIYTPKVEFCSKLVNYFTQEIHHLLVYLCFLRMEPLRNLWQSKPTTSRDFCESWRSCQDPSKVTAKSKNFSVTSESTSLFHFMRKFWKSLKKKLKTPKVERAPILLMFSFKFE